MIRIISLIHLKIKTLPVLHTGAWHLHLLKYLSGSFLKLFKSRGLLENFREFGIIWLIFLQCFSSKWLQRRFIWLIYYQAELMNFFKREGCPPSHFGWEARTLFNKDMEYLEHQVLHFLMKTYPLNYSSGLLGATGSECGRFFKLSTQV